MVTFHNYISLPESTCTNGYIMVIVKNDKNGVEFLYNGDW
jgi:hypothetical protein